MWSDLLSDMVPMIEIYKSLVPFWMMYRKIYAHSITVLDTSITRRGSYHGLSWAIGITFHRFILSLY